MSKWGPIFGLFLLWASPAQADKCDAALIKTTYQSASSFQEDSRLATLVDEETYNQLKHDYGWHVPLSRIICAGSSRTSATRKWCGGQTKHTKNIRFVLSVANNHRRTT